MAETGLLVHGDNAQFLASQPDGIADLIVTDPPFFTRRTRSGSSPVRKSHGRSPNEPPSAQPSQRSTGPISEIPSFDDRWENQREYLRFLRPRLAAMWDLLQPEGSLVIHLDYRVVHEVKVEMDRLFGRNRFVNEIIWHYTGGGRAKRYFSRKHDNLLWYAKGKAWTFNIDTVREPYKPSSGFARGGIVARSGKHYQPHPGGTPADDVWEIPIINPLSAERCGYPTQKPERLLERLILALSGEGDLVVDPFCGSGTTLVVAERLGRRWMGCDSSAAAIEIARKRLVTDFADCSYRIMRLSSASRSPA